MTRTSIPREFELSTLSSDNGFAINGKHISDNLGYSVSMGGDFNGDGFFDMLIGSFDAGTDSGGKAGQSYLLFGTNDSSSVFNSSFDLSDLDGKKGFTIDGKHPGSKFGSSVSIGGDFNGDQYSDAVICAHSANVNGLINNGQCYVLFGTEDVSSTFGSAFNVLCSMAAMDLRSMANWKLSMVR